jgi:ABC-type dipeptide/oligopeptide/nickel transport system permease subunit
MSLVLTAIVSPKVLGIMMVIILAGVGIMTKIVRSKYECTPEREKELEERLVNCSPQDKQE